jgi:hypothetical protein
MQHGQRRAHLRGRQLRRRRIEVGLVEHHQVGQLHDALLDRLQVVAGIGQLQQHEAVGHAGHRGFGLADADRLDDDDVVAGGLAQQQRLARVLGDAAEAARRGRRPDEGLLALREQLHARLVAEDRAAVTLGRGIDRQHRDAVAAGSIR